MGLPARKLNADAEKRLEEVSFSLDGKRLLFLFENGEGCSVARKDLPGDDGTAVGSTLDGIAAVHGGREWIKLPAVAADKKDVLLADCKLWQPVDDHFLITHATPEHFQHQWLRRRAIDYLEDLQPD